MKKECRKMCFIYFFGLIRGKSTKIKNGVVQIIPITKILRSKKW
jgi:hypothetical protein